MNSVKSFLDKLPPWTLSVVCFLAICWLTLAPHPLGDNDIPLFPGADKIAHAIMFGGFTLCIIIDGLRRKGWQVFPDNIEIIFYSPDIPSGVGIITEVLQGEMNAGRSFELWDMVADITGAFFVAVCAFMVEFMKYRRHKNEEDR
ncbi:MAG: hypothetical protein K2K45_08540 [Muribaculaceae bacterium]|nr:hypothetical protein [Muribaculaceae bacterium]